MLDNGVARDNGGWYGVRGTSSPPPTQGQGGKSEKQSNRPSARDLLAPYEPTNLQRKLGVRSTAASACCKQYLLPSFPPFTTPALSTPSHSLPTPFPIPSLPLRSLTWYKAFHFEYYGRVRSAGSGWSVRALSCLDPLPLPLSPRSLPPPLPPLPPPPTLSPSLPPPRRLPPQGEVLEYYPPPAVCSTGSGEHPLPAVLRVPQYTADVQVRAPGVEGFEWGVGGLGWAYDRGKEGAGRGGGRTALDCVGHRWLCEQLQLPLYRRRCRCR